MALNLPSKKTLFVAYPWDLYVRSMYQDIFIGLSKQWDIRHGSDVTTVNKVADEVEMFKNSNKQLYDIFVSGIERSEVFIADVTGANPNVMLELGIAIQLNKSILLVTSTRPEELPFDIKGFRVKKYTSKVDLERL